VGRQRLFSWDLVSFRERDAVAPPFQAVWYICAMVIRGFAVCALLLAVSLACVPGLGQAAGPSSDRRTNANPASANRTPAQSSTTAQQAAADPAGTADCNGGPCEEQQPRMIVSLPPPAPVTWSLHDRVLWAAYLLLAILGYVGIMLALSTLKKIERQTVVAEAALSAATQSAQAALLIAQSLIDAERPWITISVEPSRIGENNFNVLATNRGRAPATITETLEFVQVAVEESHLAIVPEYKNEKQAEPPAPVILLPGESVRIKTFGRDDLKGVCKSEETLKRVQSWEEKLFLCGKVVYRDMIAPLDHQLHETTWCCWYIHGRQKSGLVMAGPPRYNLHT
jgi:hypothetical protein